MLQANGNQIQISDDNTTDGSSGTWVYQLSATIDGVSYTTQTTGLGGTFTNPTIQNK